MHSMSSAFHDLVVSCADGSAVCIGGAGTVQAWTLHGLHNPAVYCSIRVTWMQGPGVGVFALTVNMC